MEGFVPESSDYRVDLSELEAEKVFEININEVRPLKRDPIFRNNVEFGTARSRVVRILRGFVANDAIPPVEIAWEPLGSDFRYKLTHGAHRFYCSLAAGFSQVPAVEGFDLNSLD